MVSKKWKKSKAVAAAMTEDINHGNIIEDNRPEISQYTEPAYTLEIGPNRIGYIVPAFLARRSSEWSIPDHSYAPHFRNMPIALPEVDEDVGHTLVHYLYSGTYQTLKQEGSSGPPDSATEYRRGVLVYCAGRRYKLDGLADHAMSNMELFGKKLSIFQILDITSDAYPKLPEDESWIPNYLKTQIENAFRLDKTIFAQERFLSYFGKAPALSKALARIMVDTLMNKSTIMSENGSEICQNEQGVSDPFIRASEDFIPEEPLLECPPPPIEEPEMLVEEVKEDSQEEALRDYFLDEDSEECLLPRPPPPHLEKPQPQAEGVKGEPQEEVIEDCFSFDPLKDFSLSPPHSPPPPEEQSTTEESAAQGLGSDKSLDGFIQLQKTKATKGKSKKKDISTTMKGLQVLDGRGITRSGRILDDNSQPIGKLVKGDKRRLSRTNATCDDMGNVWHIGKIVGKVKLLLPEEERKEQISAPVLTEESIPFEEAAPDEEVVHEDAVPAFSSIESDIRQSLCSYRGQHTRDRNWKSCKNCRALYEK